MSNAKFLTREEILAADDIKTVDVEVPEWGGSVHVRTLAVNERTNLESEMRKLPENERTTGLRERMLVLAIVDDKGARMFDDTTDVALLGAKSSAAVERVFQKAATLSGMSDDDVAELEKNSDATPSEDSSID